MAAPICRALLSEDLPAVAHWYDSDGPDWSWLMRFEREARARIWVVESKEIVGIAWWQMLGDEAELIDIRIDPNRRGSGLGAQLLGYCHAELQALDVAKVMLEVREANDAARALYRRYGYEEVGRRRNYYPSLDLSDGREDAILMACELPSEAHPS